MAEQNGPRGVGCLGVLVITFLLVVAMLGLAAYGYELQLENIHNSEEETLSEEEIEAIKNSTDPSDAFLDPDLADQWGLEFAWDDLEPIENEDHIINILLIGKDGGEGSRSDTMLLCTINTREKTLVMTSFLRDLYVEIPGWGGHNRLNAAFALNGAKLLNETIRKNFGVQVDHNIEVDFSGFQSVVAVFGGVRVDLTQKEAEYLGGGLVEGSNFLTPEQALRYVRIRKLDSDFGRTDRQRKVMLSLMGAMKDLDYEQLVELMDKVKPLVSTDMTKTDISVYMLEILPILEELEVTTQYIPAPGTYRNEVVDGKSVLVPDLAANIEILRDTLT